MEYKIESYPNVKHIELDFGQVEVGVSKIKSIKIVNQCNKKQSYVVQRDQVSNPLDCVFNTVEYAWSLSPCESYVCDISYKPILPNRNYTDYFFITDTYKCCYKIVVRGCSIGPKVESSKIRLLLICENKPCSETGRCKSQKCIKLTNCTNASAKYMFDVDIDQSPFKICEINGIIKALTTKCLYISFEPNEPGIFKYYMTCLVLNQDPIIFELYGMCGCDLKQEQVADIRQKIEITDELDITNNFVTYMSDVTNVIKSNPPPISLSHSFIDFGQAVTGIKNVSKRTPQVFSLTNHNRFDLLILWDKDKKNVFTVQPNEAKVRGNQSIIFEVRFDPTEERMFYSRELTARVFRLPCCINKDETDEDLVLKVVPEFVSVRLIGHSYRHGCNDWMPQYSIPETVIMPACVPALPVYTTFMIKNFGQQALMFSFIPPETTHYSVKPMMGLIDPEQDQLIAVQLFPGAEANRAYVERWAVRLNGNSKNEIYIDYQGYAEQANLVFADDNSVNFVPVQVNCKEKRRVSLRNTTRHNVRFEYLKCNFPKELQIEPMNGLIYPNETVYHDWVFKPDQLKNYDFDISCRLNADIGNRHTIVNIEVTGNSTQGSLLAIPEDLKFGDVAYNKCYTKEIKAFNFSPVTIHYLLSCRPTKRFEIMSNPEKDVKISPVCGSILPGRGEKIEITIIPKQTGFYELTIEYLLREDCAAECALPNTTPTNLCTLNCMCYIPMIQIKDLLYKAETRQGVGKISLWKSLAIDEINSALKELEPFHEALIEMTVPLGKLDENEKLTVKLLVKNSQPIEATWLIKKKKSCLCKDRTAKYKVPMQWDPKTRCIYCVSDEACSIRPKDLTLNTNDTGILTIEIVGNTLQSSGIFWIMDIGEDRSISLNLKLENSIILYEPYLKFKNVYIGQSPIMHHKAIWLYNGTENEQNYEVDTKNLCCINKKNYGIILTCFNPEGTIEAFGRKAVFFGFCPQQMDITKVSVLIKVGEKEETLDIEAEASCYFIKNITSSETCPFASTFISKDVIIYFSSDYVVIPPLLTHGKTTRMIMLHNHHTQDVLHYEWQNYEEPGVIKISVEPPSGLAQPQSLLTFIIEITVGNYECSMDIDILCRFIDVSERRLAEKKRAEQEDVLRQLEDEFVITEKGFFKAEKPDFPPIKEPSNFVKAVTLKIDVIDRQKAEEKLDLTQLLRCTPSDEIRDNFIDSNKTYNKNIIDMSSHIFQCMIWDIINSEKFGKTLKETLNTTHDLKYSQLPINSIVDRKFEEKRSKWIPPKRYVEDILHTMICMIVHKEFNFDTNHFTHPPDARQISYQKIYTESAKILKTDYLPYD